MNINEQTTFAMENKLAQISEKVSKALKLATQAHAEQTRKINGEPYITHPVAVAEIVAQYQASEDTICAALLHDVLEDTKISAEEISAQFGPHILKMIQNLTEGNNQTMTKEERKQTWKTRKQNYLDHIQDNVSNPETLMICAADKIHTLRSLIKDFQARGPEIWDKLNASRDEQLWYYTKILDILKKKLMDKKNHLHPIVAELATTLAELQTLHLASE